MALREPLRLFQRLRVPRLLDLVQHVFDRFGEQARRFGTDGHGRVGERGGHGVDGGVHERGRGFTPHEHPSAVGGGHRHGDTVDGGGVERRGVVAGVARERRAFGGDVGLGLALGLARRVARLVRFVVVREERVLVAAVRVRSLGLGRARVGEPVEIFVVGARLGLRGTRLGPYGGLVERAAVLVLVGGGVLLLHRVHHVHLVVVRADVHVGVVLDERIEVVKVAVVHGDRRCLFAERDSQVPKTNTTRDVSERVLALRVADTRPDTPRTRASGTLAVGCANV